MSQLIYVVCSKKGVVIKPVGVRGILLPQDAIHAFRGLVGSKSMSTCADIDKMTTQLDDQEDWDYFCADDEGWVYHGKVMDVSMDFDEVLPGLYED